MQKSNSAPQAEANKRVATACTKTMDFSLAYFDTQKTLSSRKMIVADLDISHPGEVKADHWEDGVGCISIIISLQLPPQADGTDIKYAHKCRTVRAISTPRNFTIEKSLTSMPSPMFYMSLEQGVGEDFEPYMENEKEALFTAHSGIGDLLTSNIYRPGTRPWARLNFFYRTQGFAFPRGAPSVLLCKLHSYSLREMAEQTLEFEVTKNEYGRLRG